MTSFSPSDYLKTWHEDRAKFFKMGLEERLGKPGTAYTAIDISASTTKVYLRCWKGPVTTAADYIIDEEITIITDGTGGNDAVIGENVTIVTGAGRPGPIEFEIVIVDETKTGKPTPSTFEERDYGEWTGTLIATVQP